MTRAMDWQVLLIGGGSGTGKTALARALGRRFDVSVIEGDLLRHVIEAAVPRGSDPALHIFKDPSFWEQDVDNVLAATERLARRVCQIAEVTVARQHYMGRPAILEAFWVEPEFAAQSEFDGIVMSGRVRSLSCSRTTVRSSTAGSSRAMARWACPQRRSHDWRIFTGTQSPSRKEQRR
ncbi:MAG TPA: hypothetical protein VG845_05770 [Dehalococcoidia bacterium]|nr:hypothetical protein [Dehalococcoidia bacterium]